MKISEIINLKDNKGFTVTDITISIIIIVIFVSIISTAYYNYYLTITSKNRNAVATNCIVDVIENIEMMNYEDINDTTIKSKIEELYNNNILEKQYKITATLEKYNEMERKIDKKDLIKKLTVIAEYEVNKKIEKIEISRLITKK